VLLKAPVLAQQLVANAALATEFLALPVVCVAVRMRHLQSPCLV